MDSCLCRRCVSDCLLLTVFFMPSHSNMPPPPPESSSTTFGSGVVGLLLVGVTEVMIGDDLKMPERLRARLTLCLLSVMVVVRPRSSRTSSGSTKAILGIGLGVRVGIGVETDCFFDGTGGGRSSWVATSCLGRPRPMGEVRIVLSRLLVRLESVDLLRRSNRIVSEAVPNDVRSCL